MSPPKFTVKVCKPAPEGSGVKLEDFVAYMPAHNYIFTPCRETWPASAVNARLPRVPVLTKSGQPKRDKNGKPITMAPNTWLDQNRPVEQMTWCPGMPMQIKDRLVVLGGWIERKDVTCFNLYRPPLVVPGDVEKAGPWLDHIHKIYPDDAKHIHHVACPPRATTGTKDQPRSRHGRRAGDRQRHHSRAGTVRGRDMEFFRCIANPSIRSI